MATVIVAPNEYPKEEFSVFLAGAIDMGQAVNWQAYVVEQFEGFDLIILNPRRPNFTPDTLDEQIKWELQALEDASMILLWFPQDAKAPISFFEAGLFWHSSKLIVGAEPGFYRRRNLELTTIWHRRLLYSDLEEMINISIGRFKRTLYNQKRR